MKLIKHRRYKPEFGWLVAYSISLICWSLLLSCGGQGRKRENFFRYNEATGIASLDPAFAKNQSVIWPVHQIYNTLVETDKDLNMKPSLAKSWEVSADRLTYIFHLRKDVYFHDNESFAGARGRLMKAADVEYSFKRIIDPGTASSGAWIFNDRVDSLLPFKALNDSTFQLKLSKPFHPILGLLSMQYCSVVPREVVEKFGKDFGRHPCGTGPFQLRAWEEGQGLILSRNPNYFETDSAGRRLPFLEGIKISFFDNRATEFLLFQQGELHFVNDIDPSFKDEVLDKRGELRKDWQQKIVLQKHAYLNTEYLGILIDSSLPVVKDSPLALRLVRQAINHGFDRRKMILYLRNSVGTPAESGFVPAGLPSFSVEKVNGYEFDPAKSRQLLAKAGYGNGKALPPLKLLTINTYADMAGFIAKELEDLGFHIQVEVVQKSLLLEQTAKSQATFFRASWIADYPDAENYLGVFYSKNPAPPNYTRYKNAAFDRLYEAALVELNDSIRFELYQKMDNMIVADAPVVPLWYDQVLRLVNPKVKDFEANGLNLLELRKVRIE